MMARSSRAELDVIRWICYGGFFVCLIWLLMVLSARGEFVAPLVGALFFGIQTTVMYIREHDAEMNRETVRAKAEQRGGGGTDRWNIDDRGGDPTQPPGPPPTRPQPTIIEGS